MSRRDGLCDDHAQVDPCTECLYDTYGTDPLPFPTGVLKMVIEKQDVLKMAIGSKNYEDLINHLISKK